MNIGLVHKSMGAYQESEAIFKNVVNDSKARHELDKIQCVGEASDIARKIRESHYRIDQVAELYLAIHESARDNWNEILIFETLKEYLKLNKDHGLAWIWYGRALRGLFHWRKAEKAFKKALEYCQEEIQGAIFVELGINSCRGEAASVEADKWYALACKVKGKDEGFFWKNRGQNFLFLGRLDEANECFEKVYDCHWGSFEDDEILYFQGLVFRAKKDFIRARSYFKESLEDNPENSKSKKALNGLEGIEECIDIVKGF